MSSAAGSNALMALKSKMQTLRDELDKANDQLEAKDREFEKERESRIQAENEVASLSRKLSLLEDEYEKTQADLKTALGRIHELSISSDESERAKRVLENRQNMDDDRIGGLEVSLREAQTNATEADKKYEEVVRKLQMNEHELERMEERADTAELKVKSLDMELHIATTTLKSLELSESKATAKEDAHEETIRELTSRLKEAESRSSEFERSMNKLQKDVDRLEEELQESKRQNAALREDMENAFQEIQNI